MDAVARVSAYFPAQSITSFWLISNVIINNTQQCDGATRGLLIAIMVLFACSTILCAFTDTYTASNNQKFIVLLIPRYGPICMSLPTDLDKDRVYEFYYDRVRDYVRACIACVCFVLVVVFINPVVSCLFPSNSPDTMSSLSSAVIRTIPIVVAIVSSLLMICLGPPRQSLGYQNVDETCPPLEKQINNPLYTKQQSQVYQQGAVQPRLSHMSSHIGGFPGPEAEEDAHAYEVPPGGSFPPPGKHVSMSPYSSHTASGGQTTLSVSATGAPHAPSARVPHRGDSIASSRQAVGPTQPDV